MLWFRRGRWRKGMALLSFLLCVLWVGGVPITAVDASPSVPRRMTPAVVVAATPTEDATVTALSKEKLAQEVQQLNVQVDNQKNWWTNNANALIAAFSALIIALFGIVQWAVTVRDAHDKDLQDRASERHKEMEAHDKDLQDRAHEREKRAEDRFLSAVTGLGEQQEGAKVGAAILLRTFLRPGYEHFYVQTFDLAVANLRLARTMPSPAYPAVPQSLTALSQALMAVFKEAFPLARNLEQKDPQFLDASALPLDNAFLAHADLEGIWMPLVSLQGANLSFALLRGANLSGANLKGAQLGEAKLAGANLVGATLTKGELNRAELHDAILTGVDLAGARLRNASLMRTDATDATLDGAELFDVKLNEAILVHAKLRGARLGGADLNRAKLSGADLRGADLRGARLNGAKFNNADLRGAKLNETHPEVARSLEKADLRGVTGLTNEQLAVCKAKGAIIDEEQIPRPSPFPIASLSPTKSEEQRTSSPQQKPPTDAPGKSVASSSPGGKAEE